MMKRLLSLDVLRGITVAGMILVNNGFEEGFTALQHSAWNGLTPCDLVFPSFLFIVGFSTWLSLSKAQFQPTPAILRKVVRRTVLIFAIGLFINWFALAMDGRPLDFAHLRYWAVLQRIAVCYLLTSLFALYVNHRHTLKVIVGLLVTYAIVLLAFDGYSTDATRNIAGRIDLWLFGADHLYRHSPIDPEGLLGTMSATAHMLTGFLCMSLISQTGDIRRKVLRLLMAGGFMMLLGYLLHHCGLPVNKTVWSPSFVLATCGICSTGLALLIYLIDIRGEGHKTWWMIVFLIFGVNPLFLYVFSECLAIVGWSTGINETLYATITTAIAVPSLSSLCYALTYVAIVGLVGWLLYWRKKYIKI